MGSVPYMQAVVQVAQVWASMSQAPTSHPLSHRLLDPCQTDLTCSARSADGSHRVDRPCASWPLLRPSRLPRGVVVSHGPGPSSTTKPAAERQHAALTCAVLVNVF